MTSETRSTSPKLLVSSTGTKLRNLLIVLAAVVLSLLLFFGLQQQTSKPSLSALAKSATPLDTALMNGKPSLVEFYANWCTSCQAMAGDMTTLKEEYGDRVNFVMLNVDSSKWLPEVMRYKVDGIPHFVFLNRTGEAIVGAVGEQPRTILGNNLAALIADAPIPTQSMDDGQTSIFQPDGKGNTDDPRAHGNLSAGA
jgi:thiol-disulfide isomerase/thioredoxin